MRLARLDRPLVGVEASVFGQQRGVCVQHPTGPARDEVRGQDAHIAAQRDIVGARVGQRLQHDRLMRLACEALVAVREGGDAFGRRDLQSARLGLVRGDHHDLIGAVGQARGIEQGGHGRAGAREHDGDPRLSHDGWRTRDLVYLSLQQQALGTGPDLADPQHAFAGLRQRGRCALDIAPARPPPPCRCRN